MIRTRGSKTDSHGTKVASVIAARKGDDARDEVSFVAKSYRNRNADFHGIAYGAKLHVLAISLGSADPRRPFEPISLGRLGNADAGSSALWRRALASLDGPDVINASFGYAGLAEKFDEEGLRQNHAATIAALAQSATPEADRTLIVSSAGNSNGRICEAATPGVGSECVGETATHYGRLRAGSPSVDAALMAHVPELRPHTVAVVSIGRDGQISEFSNRCGIAARWCLAASGEDMLAATYTWLGLGYGTASGTSFAAPVVSGGLAQGVPQDYVQAYAWLNLAAAGGLDPARSMRDRVLERMSPEQVAEAQALSRDLAAKHRE